jgi:hypothetical protein
MTDISEQIRRREFNRDMRHALAQGQELDAYRTTRDAKIEDLTATIRAMMERHGVDDPIEVLPHILIGVQERAIAEARAAAKTAARDEVRRMLKRAIADA